MPEQKSHAPTTINNQVLHFLFDTGHSHTAAPNRHPPIHRWETHRLLVSTAARHQMEADKWEGSQSRSGQSSGFALRSLAQNASSIAHPQWCLSGGVLGRVLGVLLVPTIRSIIISY